MIHRTFSSSSESSSQNVFTRFLGGVVDTVICGLVFLMPLWFLPQTIDVLELNKQTLLMVLVAVGAVAWLGKALIERQLSFTWSWMHVAVGVFTLGYLGTSLFSTDHYLSFVGNFGQMQWAFVSILAFVLLYKLIVNTVRTAGQLYNLILVFLVSCSVAALFGILQMMGVQVFGFLAVTKDVNFNTIGSVNSLAMFMTVPLVIAVSLTVLGCKDATCLLGKKGKGSVGANILVWVTILLSLAVVTIVDFWAAWAAVLFGMVLVLGITYARDRRFSRSMVQLIVPGIVCAVSVLLLIFSTPVHLNLPSEVSPSLQHSWQIGQATLHDHLLFGTGPGTWIYDYALHRSPVANLSQFWTTRFERSISTFFTLLATLGVVGTALWLALLVAAVVQSASHLVKEKDDIRWQAYLTVFVGWATVVFVGFVYNYNVAHQFAFWFLLALLGSLVATKTYILDGRTSKAAMAALAVSFVVTSVVGISWAWMSVQRLVADVKYSSAVMAYRETHPVQESIADLKAAILLNPMNDVYYRNLSQTYLIQANQQMQGPQTPEASKSVNATIASAITAAQKAKDLSPMNVDNWSNLADIYSSITSFTRGADDFAIKNYQEALKREPSNPVFYNKLGKLYILRADAYRTLLSSTEKKTKTDAQTSMKQQLDLAEDQLNQAIALKGDYAEAHYNLGILYEREGRLKDAIHKLEQVLQVNGKDVGIGYQLAILYYRDGDVTKALNLFEQIIALDPKYADARRYLSVIYEQQGRYDDAIAQIKAIQQTQTNSDALTQRLTQLKTERDSKTKPTVKPVTTVSTSTKALLEPNPQAISGPAPLNAIKK